MPIVNAGGEDPLAMAFLSAPFERDGWDGALRKLASQTRSARGQLIAFGGPSTIPLNWVTDPEDGFIEEFPQIEGGSPSVNWRVACVAPPLEPAWEDHYDTAKRRLKSEIYDEFVDRFDLPFGCQTVLLDTGKVFYGLAMLRSRSEGRTSEADREVFARAAPHVLAAVKLQQALEHQGATLVAGAFEALGGAVFVCDRQGRVQALTHEAEAALRLGAGLTLAGGRLMASRPDEDRSLQGALGQVLARDAQAAAGGQFWLRGGPAGPLRCEVLPLPRREWSMGFEPCAVVRVHAPEEIDPAKGAQLEALLGLTRAEADVALLAAGGLSREEIALRRGAAVNTVSSQFKSIFLKADVTREAELVALLNRLLR